MTHVYFTGKIVHMIIMLAKLAFCIVLIIEVSVVLYTKATFGTPERVLIIDIREVPLYIHVYIIITPLTERCACKTF